MASQAPSTPGAPTRLCVPTCSHKACSAYKYGSARPIVSPMLAYAHPGRYGLSGGAAEGFASCGDAGAVRFHRRPPDHAAPPASHPRTCPGGQVRQPALPSSNSS